MIISEKYKFIFIANGKTGTTSIEAALEPFEDLSIRIQDQPGFYFGKHVPASVLRELLGQEIWQDYFTFGIVRNPANRFISLLRHYNRAATFSWPSFIRAPRSYLKYFQYARSLEVPRFVETIKPSLVEKVVELQADLKIRKSFRTNFQFPMFYDSRDELCVDKVIKYENMHEELTEVFTICGLPALSLPMLNRGVGYDGPDLIFTPAARALIEEVYAEDFTRFDYAWPF